MTKMNQKIKRQEQVNMSGKKLGSKKQTFKIVYFND